MSYQHFYKPTPKPVPFQPLEVVKGFVSVVFVFGPLAMMLAVCRGWL